LSTNSRIIEAYIGIGRVRINVANFSKIERGIRTTGFAINVSSKEKARDGCPVSAILASFM
jgi:hypothetical protein